MDQSQELLGRIEELEMELKDIENVENHACADPDLHQMVLTSFVYGRILDPNDHRLTEIQEAIEKARSRILAPRKANHAERGRVAKELSALTGPAIAKGIEVLGHQESHLKLQKEVLSRDGGGFTMKPGITLFTNQKSVAKVQKIIRLAIEKLPSMTNSSIEEIEAFVSSTLEEIREIDVQRMETIRMDEFDYQAQEFRMAPRS